VPKGRGRGPWFVGLAESALVAAFSASCCDVRELKGGRVNGMGIASLSVCTLHVGIEQKNGKKEERGIAATTYCTVVLSRLARWLLIVLSFVC
jgi:hypothetical protein